MKNKFVTAAGLLGLSVAMPATANTIRDTHNLRIGYYEQEIDVNASLTVPPLPEIDIDFDDVLGIEDSTGTGFAGYRWRFTEKWNLGVYYSQLSSSGTKVATRDFNWDGEEYTAGVLLRSDFNLDTLLATVNYSFFREEKYEFGLGFGLHAFDIDTQIDVAAGVEGIVETGETNNSALLAPLPNLRVYGTYAITPKWEVSGSIGWLSITYEDYDGDYLFINLFTEYRFTEHFGMGISYQRAGIDVTHDDGRVEEVYDIDLYGPSLYITFGF